MGSFSVRCALTGAQIVHGDAVMVLYRPGYKCDQNNYTLYSGMGLHECVPIMALIRGEYNTYGTLENVQRTPGVEALERFYGMGIEDYLGILTEDRSPYSCVGQTGPTYLEPSIHKALNDWNIKFGKTFLEALGFEQLTEKTEYEALSEHSFIHRDSLIQVFLRPKEAGEEIDLEDCSYTFVGEPKAKAEDFRRRDHTGKETFMNEMGIRTDTMFGFRAKYAMSRRTWRFRHNHHFFIKGSAFDFFYEKGNVPFYDGFGWSRGSVDYKVLLSALGFVEEKTGQWSRRYTHPDYPEVSFIDDSSLSLKVGNKIVRKNLKYGRGDPLKRIASALASYEGLWNVEQFEGLDFFTHRFNGFLPAWQKYIKGVDESPEPREGETQDEARLRSLKAMISIDIAQQQAPWGRTTRPAPERRDNGALDYDHLQDDPIEDTFYSIFGKEILDGSIVKEAAKLATVFAVAHAIAAPLPIISCPGHPPQCGDWDFQKLLGQYLLRDANKEIAEMKKYR